MAIRNIVKEGDPILNKVCRPVTTALPVFPQGKNGFSHR